MADSTEKPACKYGEQCYQRNEAHKNRFSHPPKKNLRECETEEESSPESSPERQPKNKRFKASGDEETGGTSIENESSEAEPQQPLSEKAELINDSAASSEKQISSNQEKHLDENATLTQHHLHTIRTQFLLEVPKDLLLFWDYCKNQCKGRECDPVHTFDKLGMRLVGPFDVLAGYFDKTDTYDIGDYLRHWRFYYDPPEFHTVFVKTGSGIHYGIWRDDPLSTDVFIARNDANKNGEFSIVADNIFSAVLHFLDKDVQQTMFNQKELSTHRRDLISYTKQHNISLDSLHTNMKARNAKSVCKTFHRLGLVVPFDRKTEVGYRPLIETDANLRKILQQFTKAGEDKELLAQAFDELEPLITAANIACDESDFGNAIELGLDLFTFGAPQLHSAAQRLLQTGYSMINKPQFATIVTAHLENRRRDSSNLSMLFTKNKKES